MKIKLDRFNDKPLYIQLAEKLRAGIENGEYPVGVRMPSEDNIMKQLNVSKGTAKSAYNFLKEEGYLHSVRGSGTYVNADGSANKENNPQKELEDFFVKAFKQGVSASEVYKSFKKELDIQFSNSQSICVALVDSSFETLYTLKHKIEKIHGLRVMPYIANELIFNMDTGVSPLCRLIFTTQMYYPAMQRYAKSLGLELEMVVIKESDKTVIELSRLPKIHKIGLIYRSKEFFESVCFSMKMLGTANPVIGFNEDDIEGISAFAELKMPIILPSDYIEYGNVDTLQLLERAKKADCQIIYFNYEIEQGSLLRLRQRIVDLLEERQNEHSI